MVMARQERRTLEPCIIMTHEAQWMIVRRGPQLHVVAQSPRTYHVASLMRIAHPGCAIVLAALTVAAAGQTARPADGDAWRVWGGPQRDFITTATGIFPPGEKWIATPPTKLWERALGDGYSPIAVESGVLYTGFRRGSNDVITALDARDGKTLWEYEYAATFRNAYREGVGPGPYAMPQVIGDRVVTASGIGQIHSLDKTTGKPVWSLNLYRDFAGFRLDFGYSSHALPYNDSLI